MTENNYSDSLQSSIAERLRLLIVTMRKSQAEFSRLIGIDPGNLSKMLTGRTRLSSKMLDRISSNTGCSLEWLMYGTDVPFPREQDAVPVLERGDSLDDLAKLGVAEVRVNLRRRLGIQRGEAEGAHGPGEVLRTAFLAQR